MGKTFFSVQGQNNFFFNFTLFLAFKKYIPPCRKLQKGLTILLLLLILGYQSKFSKALRPRKEATLRHESLELG